jgi:hypothetical protein
MYKVSLINLTHPLNLLLSKKKCQQLERRKEEKKDARDA